MKKLFALALLAGVSFVSTANAFLFWNRGCCGRSYYRYWDNCCGRNYGCDTGCDGYGYGYGENGYGW